VTSAFPKVDFFSLTLREKFRGLTTREGVLFQGPAGWGEFSPFPNYTPHQDSLWLRAALESAFVAFDYPIDANISVNAIIGDNEDPYRASIRAMEQFGCNTVKIKVGLDRANDVKRVDAVVRAFREAEKLSDLRIRLDANGRWSVSQARETLSELNSAPIEYIEQPCQSVSELRELHQKINVPIALDESIRVEGRYQISDIADLAIIKVSPLGGIKAIEELMTKLDVPIRISGALESTVGLSASLLAAHTFAPGEVAGLGTGMLLATDLRGKPVVPHLGRISVKRYEPSAEKIVESRLSADQQVLWKQRITRAWALIPATVLASLGVPDQGMQG
jgi:O-succinylbenzoate synthase